EQFRIARKIVLTELNKIQLEIEDVLEISFYIFLLNDFETIPRKRYLKRYKRIEIEVVLSYEEFRIANEQKTAIIMKHSIIDSILDYDNKNIERNSIELIKNEFSKYL
ncbi:MAG: immunity 44 family protein, partial [Helicobacteraceae bacterium]|nr:immunity 44 family protein [Helicobacteraceae bacterium]